MKADYRDDVIFETREEIEAAIDVVVAKIAKSLAATLKAAVAEDVDDADIEEGLWDRDALQGLIEDHWDGVAIDVGDITTGHDDDDAV